MSTSEGVWEGERGRIDVAMLGRHVADLAVGIYYLTGPPGMVHGLHTMLIDAGVDEDDIRTEEFIGYQGLTIMRIDYADALPEASRAMSELERVVEESSLEPKLRELVKLRASQINGCAYCVDMHTKDAQAMGEEPQRLHLVAVWREAPVFSARERAALAWTEALTLLPETGAPDDVYAEVARLFDPAEQVALTLAIVAINGWNRLAVGFRQPVGTYVSRRLPASA